MGYYENPPIINANRGSETISASIANAASSIAQGLIIRGERKSQEEKERKLTLQKLQDRKNETDLYYNEKLSNWSSKIPKSNDAVDNQLSQLVQSKIEKAADSRILLLNETDPNKRQEYLRDIKNADVFLESSTKFAKSLAIQTATWRLDTKAIKVGEVGGHFVNGATDQEILDNTAFLEIIGGMDAMYQDVQINLTDDDTGQAAMLRVSGKHKDGTAFDVAVNSTDFDKAENESEDGFLIPVESIDTFNTQVKEGIVDKKGNIYPGYLSEVRETVDLPSAGTSGGGGKDIFQLTNAQRLQEKLIMEAIGKKAEITATGYLGADSPSRLKGLLDYTLKQGVGFYDTQFKNIKDPTQQKQLLKEILTKKAFEEMTRSLEKTTENGNTVYWNPTADIQKKEKPSLVRLGGRGGSNRSNTNNEEEPLYQEKYFDEIINGYTPKSGERLQSSQMDYKFRQNLAINLNKLTGEDGKYRTKEYLYKTWLSSPYKKGDYDTGLTMQQAYKDGKIKGKPEDAFKKNFNGELFVKGDGGVYRPVQGYNLKTATGRVELALDQATNSTEKKALQKKLREARLADWMLKNPIKKGESQQQYADRVLKSI
jgi:HD-GYP domain-containing protein (c-di-GMP phosphodiesterase class II)